MRTTTHAEFVEKAHEISRITHWYLIHRCHAGWVDGILNRVGWTRDDLVSEVSYQITRQMVEHGAMKGCFTTIVTNTARYLLISIPTANGRFAHHRRARRVLQLDTEREIPQPKYRPKKFSIDDIRWEWLEVVLQTLRSREREFVTQYFGLNGTPVHTVTEIAKAHNVTRQCVSQLITRAMLKIKAQWHKDTGITLPPAHRKPGKGEDRVSRLRRRRRAIA